MNERRKSPRTPCRHLSVLSAEEGVLAVEIHDISAEGVGLRASQPLPRRGRLQLFLPGSCFEKEVLLVHLSSHEDGWRAGALFCDRPGDPRLQSYLSFIARRRGA